MDSKIAVAEVKPDWENCGLINKSGIYILEPIFSYIAEWRENRAMVEQKNNNSKYYGFIAPSGDLVASPRFLNAYNYSNGLAPVLENSKWGFLNKSGVMQISNVFEDIASFSESLCSVKKGGKWHIINNHGDLISNKAFQSPCHFHFGHAVVEFGKKKYVIDKSGNFISRIKEKANHIIPVSSSILVYGNISGYPGEMIYGFMTINGDKLSKPIFYTDSDSFFNVGHFFDGKIKVRQKNGKEGYFTTSGEYFVKEKEENKSWNEEVSNEKSLPKINQYDKVYDFAEGVAIASKNNSLSIIDETGKVLSELKYQHKTQRTGDNKGLFLSDYFPRFSCNRLVVEDERKDTRYFGYINHYGELVIGFQYQFAKPFIELENE
jgi:hypothetical protein